MKMAVNTPISAVTPKATVGNGEVSPKFSRRPLPVDTSTVIATANPIIANRPSHISKPPPSLVPCSDLIEKIPDFRLSVLWREVP